jgi:hypothetical protein
MTTNRGGRWKFSMSKASRHEYAADIPQPLNPDDVVMAGCLGQMRAPNCAYPYAVQILCDLPQAFTGCY